MQGFLTEVGKLVSALFVDGGSENGTAWVTSIVTCITSNPILYIGFIISVACLGVGVVKRLSKLG